MVDMKYIIQRIIVSEEPIHNVGWLQSILQVQHACLLNRRRAYCTLLESIHSVISISLNSRYAMQKLKYVSGYGSSART